MFFPLIFDDRASLLSRVPSQSGHVVNVTARSTNARMCGCNASTSLERNDFWICGISPRYVKLIPSTLILVGSLWSRSCSSFLVYLRIGLPVSKKPLPRKMRPYQPSMLKPGIVSAPSSRDLLSSYRADRSKSVTAPMPSQRGHMPPRRVKVARSVFVFAPRSTVIAPLAFTEGTLNEYALGGPMCGFPSRLKRMRSIALASVAVPTVERGLEPIRSWSTMIAVVRPSSTSTSGRATVDMKPCRKAL